MMISSIFYPLGHAVIYRFPYFGVRDLLAPCEYAFRHYGYSKQVIGKPVGIFGFSYLSVKLGFFKYQVELILNKFCCAVLYWNRFCDLNVLSKPCV